MKAGRTSLRDVDDYGLQPTRFAGAEAWVLPSTSGAANRWWDVRHWRDLGEAPALKRIRRRVPEDEVAAYAASMERGPFDSADAERAILDLLARRGPGKTICPSDAARLLGGDDGFRSLMALVRDAAGALAAAGQIEVTQRGRRVDVDEARGPIRLRAVPRPRGS